MVAVRHATQASGTNNPDKQVSVDAWNESHAITGTAGKVLGFDSTGVATELDAGLSVANRADLAAAPTGIHVYLRESGREGLFVFDGSNLSTQVSADTNQGIYVAKSTDGTGASGAWVRKFNGAHNVKWFGAVGDNATNDGAAVLAAVAYLTAIAQTGFGYSSGASELRFPLGKYFMGTNTIDLTTSMRLTGEGVGGAVGATSLMRWSAGATGIRVQRYNTTGSTAVLGSPLTHGGDGSVIQGLFLSGGYTSTEAEYYGIQLRARATIRDCYIEKFQGDGIYIKATAGGGAGSEGNANCFEIEKTYVQNCRNGLYVDGADANAGSISDSEFNANRQWGVWDSSFLGNTYDAVHTASNGWDGAASSTPTACTYSGNRYYVKPGQAAGASTNAPSGTAADNTWWGYISAGGTFNGIVSWVSGTTFREGGSFTTDDANAANMFSGCYFESDQNPPQIARPATVIGGNLAGSNRGSALSIYTDTQSELAFGQRYGTPANSYINVNNNSTISGIRFNKYAAGGGSYTQEGAVFSFSGGFYYDTPTIHHFRIAGVDKLSYDGATLAVAGGITTTADTTGVLEIGRYSAGFPDAFIKPSSTCSNLKLKSPDGNDRVAIANASTTFSHLLITLASASGASGFRLPHGAAPSSPVDGDVWTTTGGVFARINAATKTIAFLDSALTPSSVASTGAITSSSATAGIGYATGAGGTVTQATSRTTGVTLNKICGAITLVSAAGSASWQTFTVTNSAVAATDVIRVSQKSGTDKYMIHVTAVGAGTFDISFATTGGTTTEQPVFNFAVVKAVAA